MSLKKRFVSIALCVMLLTCMMPLVSRAVSFSVALSGTAFSGDEYVSVVVSVYNSSAAAMTDIHVSALNQSYGFNDTIGAGESCEMQIPEFYLPAECVGSDITFTLIWSENGTRKTDETTVFVPDKAAEPTPAPEELIVFTCDSENTKAKKGEKIKINYRVENNSPYDITDITITDSGIAEGAVITGKSVKAGETGVFTYEYTMGDSNVTTSPIMSYTMEGEIKSLRGEPITLESVTVNMDVDIVVCEATEKGTEFIIKLENNGNKSISSIRIYQGEEATDDTKIQHAFDLEPGQSREISYFATPKGKEEVTFIVTGRLATGQEYYYKSETYTVWEYINGTVDMSLKAEVKEKLDKDGYVSIDFVLKNLGTVDMTGITLSGDGMGKIGAFSDLAGGGEETLKLTIYAGEARDMHFVVTAIAPNGREFEYTAEVSADDAANGADDTSPSGGFDAAAIDVGGAVSALLRRILTVLAILSGILGVGLVVLSVFEFQQNSENRRQKSVE